MPRRPTQREAILALIESEIADVHTAFPAEVVEYDAARQTVDVQPVVRDFRDDDSGAPVFIDRPLLHDVPVGFPRGGGFHLTLPIAKGDHVLVICSEQDTLIWRQTGRVSNPGIADRHQINGCFALPCGYPDTKAIGPAPSGDNLVIGRDGESGDIVVTPSGSVLIGADATKECARKGDTVKVTIPAETFLVEAQAGVPNPAPVEVDGEITSGSSKVKVSD